jgi:prolipoprotein diacylglyceryl transferase
MPTLTWNVDPELVRVGSTGVRYYSIFFWLSLVGGCALFSRQIRRGGGDVEEAGDFLSYAIVGILVGARLGHVLFYDFDKAAADPAWIFEIWNGGLASHGALVGLWLAMLLFTKRRAIPFLDGSDRLTFAAALAGVPVRLGNLFNSEIVGKPTDGSWGVRFPRYDGELAPLRHPAQLYEAALGAAVFLLLCACDRALGRESRPRGLLTGVFLVSYFGGRFLIEFFKEFDGPVVLPPLTQAQLLSLPCLVAGALIARGSLRLRRPAGWVVSPISTPQT